MSPVIRTQVLSDGAPLSVLAPEGALVAGAARWSYQVTRDARLFDVAWLLGQRDLRQRLRGVRMQSLESAREAFRQRLDAACAAYTTRYACADAV